MSIKIPNEQKRRFQAKLFPTDKEIRAMAKSAAKSAIQTKKTAEMIGFNREDTKDALQRNLLKRWIRTKRTDFYGQDAK